MEANLSLQDIRKSFELTLQMFREQSAETERRFRETDQQFKETNKKFREQSAETERMFRETDRQFKETDKKFREQSAETERMFRETDKQFKETDKKINQISGLFTTQWGKLVEALVAPACLRLFRVRGVDVSDTQRNRIIVRGGEKKAEYDVVLANGTEVVIVEVKTTLKIRQVDYFVKKLSEVKDLIADYSNKKIYGAVAAISFAESSDSYAHRKGLFVIKSSGEGVVNIANDANFEPKSF